MRSPGRFGRRWRESTIEALESDLRELQRDPASPWRRHPTITYQVNRYTEWLKIQPAVVLHLGRRQAEFLSEPGWDPFIHPADLPRADTLWLRCVLGGKPYTGLEYRWKHAETGKYVCLSETLFPISWGRDGKPLQMGGWFENVTPRKRAELEFLLSCLDASRRWSARDARREIVRRAPPRGRRPPRRPGPQDKP
jgi:PAS domain-containing protein